LCFILEYGYYPYYKEKIATYPIQVEQSIYKTLHEDLPAIENIEYSTILKIKKLLATIAEMVPFMPNISNLGAAMEIGRHALVKYFYLLDKAGIILGITEPNQTLQTLAKPQKVYLENTNIIHSLAFQNSNAGNVRETFLPISYVQYTRLIQHKTVILQLMALLFLKLAVKIKNNSQIKTIENAYIAADNIETGFAKKMP